MGLLDYLFGSKDDSKGDDEDRDDDGVFTSIFGSPGGGRKQKDEDLASGNYKEKDWYEK